jgi:sterol desaturase/sphingolipid hydroxylase (fatty acid hydroxylase superfamily)
VSEAQIQLLRGGGFVAALLAALLLQRLLPHARLRGSSSVNAGLWALNLVVMGLVCGACACLVARWAAAGGVGLMNVVPSPPWLAVVITVLALDGVSYAWHRANHRLPLLWRFHQVHHSDPRFTVSTGVRFHTGELLLSLPLRLVAVASLGAPVAGVLAFESVFALANLVEHGDIALPLALERRVGRVCVTPALHRRHHTKAGRDRDTNFGTILVLWDRVFGTFAANDSTRRIETGLAGLDRPIHLVEALFLPLSRLEGRP